MANRTKKLAKRFEQVKELVLEKALIKSSKKSTDENGEIVADNIKLGNMGSWMILPGNLSWFIPELQCWVNGTCGQYCKGCYNEDEPKKSPCYVFKSIYQHTNRNEDGSVGDIIMNPCTVKLGQAYRTIAITMFRDELLCSLDGQLTRKRDKFPIIRVNESGELTCFDDLKMWSELSRRHPETQFYLYTKNYKAVREAITKDIIPNNLWINISIWHNCGIKEYLEFSSHPQIRAYVLIDSNVTVKANKRNGIVAKLWDIARYKKHGIEIESMCPAYDINGKMNHDITCDKCGKAHCFSCKNKVTGCYDHQ